MNKSCEHLKTYLDTGVRKCLECRKKIISWPKEITEYQKRILNNKSVITNGKSQQ